MKSTGIAIAVSALACIVAPRRVAYAEGPYDGTWRASPMEVRLAIESWGRDCGARPQTQSTIPGGTALIQQTGDHLRINGAVSGQTNGCWTDNRNVRRISTSYRENTWRTVCRTPENDPRSEIGTYTLSAQGTDRLELREQTQYDWQLNESRCLARRTSQQTLRRETTAAAQPTKTPSAPPAEQSACTPGAPARIQLQPSRAQIEPGSRTCFRAQISDARGCALPGERIHWELERPAALVARLRNGCFSAGATAAEAEGEYRVIASSGALRASAAVVVRTADLSDLIARRISPTQQANTPGVEPQSAEARRVAARAVAVTRQRNLLLWGGLGAVLVGLLAITILAALLRRRRRAARADVHEGVSESMPPPAATTGQTVVPEEPRAVDQALICPVCRRGYPADSRFCPHDAEQLIPYALFVERGKQAGSENERTKICPRCGERYPRSVTFCGKDGSELVLVN